MVFGRKAVCVFALSLVFTVVAQDVYFLDGEGLGRLHLFEGEQTAVLSSGNQSVMAVAADGAFSRIKYDGFMRIVSRVDWNTPKNDVPVVAMQTDYSYEGNSGTPSSSIMRDFVSGTIVRSTYTADGNILSENRYVLPPNEVISGKNHDLTKDDTLISETTYVYNSDSHIMEKCVTTHKVNEPPVRERTVYLVPGNERGGHELYVDGTLRRTVIYLDEDEYSDTVFFPGGQSVEAVYSGARLVEEVFYMDGKELRRSKY